MLFLLFLVLGFIGMELFSWWFHKHLMHGPLWFIHKTHHLPKRGFFELNDVFSLLFGLSAAWAIVYGLHRGYYPLAGLGFGVTLYGLVYFILHDVAIHNRVKSRALSRLSLLGRIRRAHKIHHKSVKKHPSRSFGLLFVHKSVFHPAPDDNS